jgi:hypothetical protein
VTIPVDPTTTRRQFGWAVVFVMSIALLCWPGDLGGRDALTRYDHAHAMLQGHLAVDGSEYSRGMVGTVWYRRGPDGHVYSDYPLLHSLLMLPFIYVSDTPRAAALLSPLLLLPLLALYYSLLRQCSYAPRSSLLTMVTVTLTTLVLPYAVNAHNNCLQALLVLAVVCGLVPRGPRHLQFAALAGAAFGALLNVRLWAVASIPMITFLLVDVPDSPSSSVRAFLVAWCRSVATRSTLFRCLAFTLGAMPLTALFFWYEWVRFGGPLGGVFAHGGTLSQSRPWLGVLGLLFSPSKSILLFSPTVVLGLVLLPGFFRRSPRVAIATVIGSASIFAMTSVYFAWHGDVCWGPRYILPAIPLLCLPVAELFEQSQAVDRRVVRLLLASGLLVQLVCVSVHPFRFFVENGRDDADLHGPNAVAHVFSLEFSALSSGLVALPEVISCSIDGWTNQFASTNAEARQLDFLRRNPGAPKELRDHAHRQYLLRRNKAYNTLTYWWIVDNILPQSYSWPRPVSWIALPLLLLLLCVSGHRIASRNLDTAQRRPSRNPTSTNPTSLRG